MKPILVRFVMFAVLVVTGGFLYLETSVSASESACWEQAYSKWMGCDTAYSNTLTQYFFSPTTCATSSSSTCGADANTYCTTQATNQCSGNPDPNCYGNAYGACYNSRYQSCYSTANTACMTAAQGTYNNRGSAYGSCLGFEGNFGNCIEQVDGGCSLAQDRVATCNAIYTETEDADARMTCINASGINQCQ